MHESLNVSHIIADALRSLADAKEASILSRFFKTGKGEYGEGDLFLGVRVPQTRDIVKRKGAAATIADIDRLTLSAYHEERLSGFLLLERMYRESVKAKEIDKARQLAEYYIKIIERGNNWDLVDLVCYKILGDAIVRNLIDMEILHSLAKKSLWHQRVSVVSTMAMLRKGDINPTLTIVTQLLDHPHSLIHKANGWLLREAAKRDKNKIHSFLISNIRQIPRTTLRYAIERFSDAEKKFLMSL